MARTLAVRFAIVLACPTAGCQLVDPPSDVMGGRRPADGAAGSESESGLSPFDSGDDGGTGRILCATDASIAGELCPAGTETCCYTDPTVYGSCGTIASCPSPINFLCSSFNGCPANEVCCSQSNDLGPYNALGGSRCADITECDGAAFTWVLCEITDDKCATRGPQGTSCQQWGSVLGNAYPPVYWVCK
jgi:hypothetical protein